MEDNKHQDYIEYSSGDSKMIKSKQKFTEENNNELDELSKEFSEMGCIVNPDKRPSNVCIETCVYEGDEQTNENDDAAYSDEFEEDKSDDEELKLEPVSPDSYDANMQDQLAVKLTNSRTSMGSKPPPTVSGRSTSTGSNFIPVTRRVNMSFTNERLREIERHNHILLNKILNARNKGTSSIPSCEPPKRPMPPAAMQRKLAQKKIDHDNMILLKKIQRAKSSAYSARR